MTLRNNKTQLNKLIEMRELEFILKNPGTYLSLVRRSANSMKKKFDQECIGIDYLIDEGNTEDS